MSNPIQEPITVVIADDLDAYRNAQVALLNDHPRVEVVGTATDGAHLVDVVANAETHIDVVVMDMVMPNMNGVQATRSIRDISPDTRILAVSEFDRADLVFPVIQAGARGYVLKATRDIAEAICAVARGEALFSPQIASRILFELNRSVEDLPEGVFELSDLSPRERQVLSIMVSQGLTSNGEIATGLHLEHGGKKPSPKTVAHHITSILNKLQKVDRAKLMWLALSHGQADLVAYQIVEVLEVAFTKGDHRSHKREWINTVVETAQAKGAISRPVAERVREIANE